MADRLLEVQLGLVGCVGSAGACPVAQSGVQQNAIAKILRWVRNAKS